MMGLAGQRIRVPTRVAAALVVLLLGAAAAAEPSAADRAAAEALFRDARSLMKKQSYADACSKLEESQRLDPQGGTLLNLAVCHARLGKTASAWVEFQEALDLAKEAKRDDRVRLAKQELKKLDGHLARLTVEVPGEARVPGLRVTRGSEEVGEGGFGAAVPVDPGAEIQLSASAPGYSEWKTTVTLKDAEQKTVVIPKLEKQAAPAPTAASHERPSASDAERASARRTRRTLAYAAGGVGVAAVAVGSFFGLRAISKKNASENHCTGKLCDPEGLDANNQAKSAATVSNVAFGVGLLALGAGTYLFLSSTPEGPSRAPAAESANVRLYPSIGPHTGAILMSGRW